ncbi:MAG TPA: hypothetical protein VNU71_05625 [Burkholderiaceae bacterium]|nr:hypothetical protein [Burkholderiaceae bacterium]
MKTRAAFALLVLLAGCANKPPAPDWQGNAKASSERAVAAYLTGDARVHAAELARARSEVGRTGRADLLARVELTQCAAQVASLVFGPCVGFEALRADAAAPERAYADYLAAKLAPADVALLPESQRAIAANPAANPAALAAIADPLARLIAAGVLFEGGHADPATIALAVDTASAQGWRRPLLAWLGVQLKLAEQAGAGEAAERLRRRIALVQGGAS